MMGLPLILIMIILIWSPIIAFALINTIGNITPPESAIMTVSLEGFPVILHSQRKKNLYSFIVHISASLQNGSKGFRPGPD
jgi:hypothetical protein